MANTLEDPEFGTIFYDNPFWRFSQLATVNGVEIPVYFDAQTDGKPEISPVERQAFRQLFSLLPDALQKATPLLVQNYEEIYKQIEQDEDDEYLEYLPKFDTPSEIWQFVELGEFLVMKHDTVTIPTFF